MWYVFGVFRNSMSISVKLAFKKFSVILKVSKSQTALNQS